jgi:hypothetical protein
MGTERDWTLWRRNIYSFCRKTKLDCSYTASSVVIMPTKLSIISADESNSTVRSVEGSQVHVNGLYIVPRFYQQWTALIFDPTSGTIIQNIFQYKCKIWGFHCSDYEECRLLGYKNPVRTSQETHHVSTTESSQLMLCKTRGFNGDDYEECRVLGWYAVWLLYEPTFRRNVSPTSSRWHVMTVFLRNVLRLLVTANDVPR